MWAPHPEHLLLEEEPLQVSGPLPPACRAGRRPEKLRFPWPITRSLLLPPLCLWSISMSRMHTPGTLLQKSGHTPVSPP